MSALSNKIIFITGASSRIVKACAEQFAAQRARIILSAARIEDLTKLAENLHHKIMPRYCL